MSALARRMQKETAGSLAALRAGGLQDGQQRCPRKCQASLRTAAETERLWVLRTRETHRVFRRRLEPSAPYDVSKWTRCSSHSGQESSLRSLDGAGWRQLGIKGKGQVKWGRGKHWDPFSWDSSVIFILHGNGSGLLLKLKKLLVFQVVLTWKWATVVVRFLSFCKKRE